MLAAAAGAAVVLLGRDGEDETQARRDAVSAYIVSVNTTQQTLILQLERVSSAYRNLKLSQRVDRAQLERVEEAERTLRNLRARLARIAAPAEARALRTGLLRLVDLQAQLAREVAGMVRYIPVQAAENRKLAAATKRLRDALESADTGTAQKDAFGVFRQALLGSVKRLEAADAPDVLEPARTGEIARLRKLAGLADELGAALDAQAAEDVDRLFPRFVQTSASTGTTPAERQAVIAFNKRLAAINDQRAAVTRERSRLDLALR